ncbi:MAG: class I SAM-dependent methyltransferase [Thermodesulfobacteriota bacterium]
MKCGLQFLDPIPDKKTLDEIYSNYYKAWDIDSSEKEVSRMKSKTFSGYLGKIATYHSSGTLLDIGCATGELLQVAQGMGFDVYGVEISPDGIRRCRETFGENKIIGANIKVGDFPCEFFDIITLSDVIEHVHEPTVFLDTLCSLLKPDGLLMIVTPDTSSWTRKIMKKRWLHYKEEHLYYYSRANIVKLFDPHLKIIMSGNAYKTLTIEYFLNILKAYSEYSVFLRILYLCKLLPSWLRLYSFKLYIGEMFILCRKNQNS